MPNVLRLVPKTVEDARAMVEAMTPSDRAQVSQEWLARINSSSGGDQWTLGYTLVLLDGGAEVGHCGFKGPPSQGVVEIAYGVAPDHRGRGYATEAAQALVDTALGSPDVQLVIAHTLERTNASASVLSKTGFTCTGQVTNPEDGVVWTWERTR
jgi:RimJ/RimL family protein N-acetyltransferase